MSLSSEPKAKEIDDEVSKTSDSDVAAPTRHVKMRARKTTASAPHPGPLEHAEWVGEKGDHR